MHLRPLRIWWVWLAIVGLFASCTPDQQPQSKKPTEEESQRPAIRVVLVGSNELAEGMKRRWQGTSQQPIAVTTMSVDSLLAEKGLKADIVIYPARLLGELVERKWLNPLPTKLVEKYTKGAESELSWPVPWQGEVTYGKRLWGIPMGVSIPVVVRQPPAVDLQRGDSKGAVDSKAAVDSKGAWPLAVSQGLNSLSRPIVDQSNIDQSNIDHNAMIDRYLMILASQSTVSPNTGTFFQLRDLKPRLLEPAFAVAAKEFAQCGSASSIGWTGSHEQAWSEVQQGALAWSIGIPPLGPPKSDNQPLVFGRFENGSQGRSGMVVVDSGNGLVASVSITTFQSSVATYLLEWLDQNDQREALGRDSPSIQTRSTAGASPPANRPDLIGYQRLGNQWLAQGVLLQELRFRGGDRYRKKLGETLFRILEKPEKIPELLKECRQEWETISEELGRDAQQRSLERTLQLLEADTL